MSFEFLRAATRTALSIVALAVVLIVATLSSQAGAQSLRDALTLAYKSNPRLEAARAQLRARDEDRPSAIAGWLPTVTINATAGLRSSNSTNAREVSTKPRTYAVEVNQTLFRGGGVFADLSRADNLIERQRASLASTEQNVLLEGVTAYMNVVRGQAVLGLRENNVQVLLRQLEATQDRFDVGENTRTDVAQSQSRLASAEAQRTAARGELARARANYRQVIGEAPGALEQPPLLIGLPPTLDAAHALAVDNNPDVKQAAFAEAAAQDDIDRSFSSLLPSLSLSGGYTHSAEPSVGVNRNNASEIVGRLRIPLYRGGSEHAGVRASKQTAAQRRLELDDAKRRAVENAVAAWEALETARAQIVSFEAEVNATQIALEGVVQEQAVGARTVLDILDAEQEALDAQVNLVRAQRDRVVAGYQLLSAVGALNVAELDLAVDIYDPIDNFNRTKWRLFGTGID